MSHGLQKETEKDKRLLVLLAFGMLLLLVRVPELLPDRRLPTQSWGWVEGRGEGGGLRRVLLTKDGRAHQRTEVSPRLAFLLNLSFSVNRATAEELTLLRGIGPKLAASIVNYRQRHGRIKDARELQAVPGIGERLAARIAPRLTFD